MMNIIKISMIAALALGIAIWAPAENSDRKLLAHPEPEYPALAQKLNLHGTVKVRVWVTPAGEVRRLEYIGGHPVLAEAALKAVKTWKFETGKDEATTIIELKF